MHFSTIILVLPLYLYIASPTAENKIKPFRSLTESIETFSVKFFQAVAYDNNEDNLIASPLSAHFVLSMAAYGADGNTVREMKDVLHLPINNSISCQDFEKLLKRLRNQNKDVTINIANRIYINNRFKLRSEFKKLINKSFSSGAREVNVTDPKRSAQIINNWIEKNTKHKIHSIISEEDITDSTRMILLNAIYFKGNWKNNFIQRSTENRTFHIDNNNKIQVPTMFNYDEYVIGELHDLRARFIVIPYRNSDLSMVVILPDEIDGLSHVITNLNSFNYTRLNITGSLQKIYVYLPKFKIESSIWLQNPLQKLGMTEMFTDQANFAGIAKHPLLVTQVIQKAFIDVNEEGTEAAASTVSMMVPYSYDSNPRIIKINKPFLFKIIDTRDKMTIFVGAVTNPKKN